jgi:hypothetical protein
MRTCDEILDRLFDEDCRRALAGAGAVPGDVAVHLASCAGCNAAWRELGQDALALPATLLEEASPAARAAALAALAQAYPTRGPLLDWRATVAWAIAGGALAICAVALLGSQLSLVWQAVAVVAAGSLGAATDLTRQGLEA